MKTRSMTRNAIRVAGLVALFAWASLAGAATYYVATTGSDAADGKSKKTAWKTMTHAALVARAGDTVRIAEGQYGPEHIRLTASGTAERPIVFEGRGKGPTFDRGARTSSFGDFGLLVFGCRHVTLRNLNFRQYMVGVSVQESDHITLEDVRTNDCGWERWMGTGIEIKGARHCLLKECTSTNAGGDNIHLLCSDDNVLEDCKAIGTLPSSDRFASDYYLVVSWSNRNKIRNFVSHDTVASGKGNHGVGIKDSNEPTSQTEAHGHSWGNEFIHCRAINFEEGLYVSWGAHHNTFTDCFSDCSKKDYYFSNAIMVRDGAHHNTFKDCRAIAGDEALCIYENEMPRFAGLHDPAAGNRFVDCTFETRPHPLSAAQSPTRAPETVHGPSMFLRNTRDTTFERCTFLGGGSFFRFGKDSLGRKNNAGVRFVKCKIKGIGQWLDRRTLKYPWAFGKEEDAAYDGLASVTFERCKFSKNGFAEPSVK